MADKLMCVYCGTRTYRENNICPVCREKLKLIRLILRWGTEMKLQAARENTQA